MFSPSVSWPLTNCFGSASNVEYCSATHVPLRVELRLVGGLPPVLEVAVGVELRALIVEAVRELVADHHADAAEVRGDASGPAPKNGGCRMPAGSAVLFAAGRSRR